MPRFPLSRAAWRRAAAMAAKLSGAALVLVLLTPVPSAAQDRDDAIRLARDAFIKKDRAKLAALRAQVIEAKHPLAPWVDYWELSSRLGEVRTEEVETFYQRWPGSY